VVRIRVKCARMSSETGSSRAAHKVGTSRRLSWSVNGLGSSDSSSTEGSKGSVGTGESAREQERCGCGCVQAGIKSR